MKIMKYVEVIGCVLMLNGCTMQKQLPEDIIPKEQLSDVLSTEVDEEITSSLIDKNILINVDNKTIDISDEFITGMEKIYWLKNERITVSQEELSNILTHLNKSNIVGLDINYDEIIEKQKDGLSEEYPIIINNTVNVDIKIASLIERSGSLYVKLEIYGPKDNVKIICQSDIPENESTPDRVYVICYLESNELYHAIKKLWKDRIYLNNIKEVTGAEILLNEKASIKGNVDKLLTKEETERLVSDLQKNSMIARDSHPFGITIRIKTMDGEEVEIYYAEDGCGLFQLDGQNYVIKTDTKFIEELENFIVKLHEGS